MNRTSAALLLALLAACSSALDPEPELEPAPPPEALAPILAKKLVIAVSSYSGDEVSSAMAPLVAHLTRALGIPVELRVGEPYRELPQLLREGAVDVAQLSPLVYVRLGETLPGVEPVATPVIGGSPTYLGHVYVRAESTFGGLADLRGKRIALVADSTSGALFPRSLVRRKGFDPDTFFGEVRWFHSHPQVLEELRAGRVDAAASFDMTTDWTGPLQRPEDLRVVAKTERIPNDCIVARPGFDPGAVAALRRELLALRPGIPGADVVLRSLRVNGWVRADAARYERVRASLVRDGGARAPGGE